MKQFSLGDISLLALNDGSMYFDGGALFHTVPKALWERKLPCDEQNRVAIALNSLYFELGEKKILLEAGAGNKFNTKQLKIFKRQTGSPLIETLQSSGIEQPDLVLLSHLHRDHSGSLTYYANEKGVPECSFPDARHIVHQEEWRFANAGNELSRASYNPEDFLPVYEAGGFEFFDNDQCALLEGLSMRRTAAHSPGHSIVTIESRGELLIFPADIIPTRHHIKLNWTCSYDFSSYDVVEEKRKLLHEALERNALLYLVHEHEYPLGRVGRSSTNEYFWKPCTL